MVEKGWTEIMGEQARKQMRPPCNVCGKQGLQHYVEIRAGRKEDVWFCAFSCELTWRKKNLEQEEERKRAAASAASERAVKERRELAEWNNAVVAGAAAAKAAAPKRLCKICKNKIGHDSPRAVFCSSMCADSAAQVYHEADRAFRFLCGLNLQDHPVKEQRELLEIVRQMKYAFELARHRGWSK